MHLILSLIFVQGELIQREVNIVQVRKRLPSVTGSELTRADASLKITL